MDTATYIYSELGTAGLIMLTLKRPLAIYVSLSVSFARCLAVTQCLLHTAAMPSLLRFQLILCVHRCAQ